MGKVIEAAGVGKPAGGVSVSNVILFSKLSDDAIIPTRSHVTDAGFDLYCNEDIHILPGERKLVSTGVAAALPSGTVGLVSPRSGLAIKDGITVTNAPGIVDSGYRGELKVILHNTDSKLAFSCAKHSRIAQMVVVPYYGIAAEVSSLPSADRGMSGFGSTGQ